MLGDFCPLTQEMVFPVGVTTQSVRIQLVDDQTAEDQEVFYIQLLENDLLRNAILHGNVRSEVLISNEEDCK